jgi:hypothetical protein
VITPGPSDRNQPHRSNQRRGVRSVQSKPSTRNRRFSHRLPSQPPAAVARATHPAARDSTANIQSIPKQEENCPERAIALPESSTTACSPTRFRRPNALPYFLSSCISLLSVRSPLDGSRFSLSSRSCLHGEMSTGLHGAQQDAAKSYGSSLGFYSPEKSQDPNGGVRTRP